jgi:hypothetical protein
VKEEETSQEGCEMMEEEAKKCKKEDRRSMF